MSYPETLENNIQRTGRMYFVISRGTIKRTILTGISNKLMLDIKWNSKKKKISTKEVKEGRIEKQQMRKMKRIAKCYLNPSIVVIMSNLNGLNTSVEIQTLLGFINKHDPTIFRS